LAPAVLELRALAGDRVEVRWRLGLPRPRGADPRPRLPAHCRPLSPERAEVTADAITTRWLVDCGGRLAGETLEVTGLPDPLAALVRVTLPDGRVADGVLTASAPRFVVPVAPTRRALVRSYLRLGVEHVGTGLDHLLCVLGLVLLSATWGQVLATVTAFTIGHSVTLALATLGRVRLPPGPVELAIALSVLVVAIEVAQSGRTPTANRRPWLIAGAFGLLHGLGFAAVLHDAGLPAGAMPLALLAFNAGIELGQVAFVLAILATGAALRRSVGAVPAWSRRAPAYAMGTIAAYWSFQRAAAWLAA
jgi:hydrogenase/urease accessory protein HupE